MEAAGQRGSRKRHHHEIADGEVGCTADDVTRLRLADINLAGPDRLLELGELLDLGDPSHGQRALHRTEGDDVFDLVADAHQRLLEVLRRHVPSGSAGADDVPQPAVRNPHQAPTPKGSEKRTSPSTMSRMSGMPLRNCKVRSRPMPNAKPEYSSGSIPTARNTFGLTMPQPPHSTQPAPPFLFSNQTSTSAEGSVNGKKCGRIRVRPCGPNSARANASRVPRRLAIVRPLSTARPST